MGLLGVGDNPTRSCDIIVGIMTMLIGTGGGLL
jgi:hypothetical protein